MRSLLAALGGIIAGGLTIMALEFIGHKIFPFKLNIDPTDIEQLKLVVFKIPVQNLIAVIVAHGIGMLVGMVIARMIDKKSMGALYGVGGITILFTAINLFTLPHPAWFIIADLGVVTFAAASFIYKVKKA